MPNVHQNNMNRHEWNQNRQERGSSTAKFKEPLTSEGAMDVPLGSIRTALDAFWDLPRTGIPQLASYTPFSPICRSMLAMSQTSAGIEAAFRHDIYTTANVLDTPQGFTCPLSITISQHFCCLGLFSCSLAPDTASGGLSDSSRTVCE
jgi:hypothetical protein